MPKDQTKSVADDLQEVKPMVVAIGASAGGLEALQDFFTNMPANNNLAFVVIQHLSPDYKSLMVELLSKFTSMNVVRVEDNMPIEKNTIFLIPPKKNMEIKGGILHLTDQGIRHGLNLPIDIFFQSLAADMGEKTVGIILSGTGSDGTRGVRALKETGGMIMVQSIDSAKFDGMPKNAQATGLADYILEPAAMPEALLGYLNHPYVANKPASSGSTIVTEEDALSQIFAQLRNVTGVDFTFYKPTTVIRRIERRMGIVQAKAIDDYATLIKKSEQEVETLYKDLLIGVTKFFRDPNAFENLQQQFIPKLLKSDDIRDNQLRIWIVGCSTGEEAYSLAMILNEQIEKSNLHFRVKIFATDIDRAAIETASSGFYPESVAADVAPARLAKYFEKQTGGYRILRSIREMVVFAQHDVTKDPPFTKIDLISCRNLLIYLQTVLQKKVLSIFDYSLRDSGFLFLGSSETVGDMTREFTAVDSRHRIYRHVGSRGLPFKEIQTVAGKRANRSEGSMKFIPTTINNPKIQKSAAEQLDAREAFYQDILNRVSKTILVVNEDLHLMHTFGRPKEYLNFAPGRTTFEVLSMLPKELSMALSSALHRVKKEKQSLSYNGIRVDFSGTTKKIDMIVEQLEQITRRDTLYCVFINDHDDACRDDDLGTPSADEFVSLRINDLEQELRFTKEYLQAAIEELQTSNEELQATNEELLSANEELQSTNEELQSVNEELNTVNAEYQDKITELTELYNDMTNLVNSTNICTIFLDKNLRIRRFTSSTAQIVNLKEHDIGRSIADFALPGLDNFNEDAQSTISTGKTVEYTFNGPNGDTFLLRMLPYIDSNNESINGLVITFIDLSSLDELKYKT